MSQQLFFTNENVKILYAAVTDTRQCDVSSCVACKSKAKRLTLKDEFVVFQNFNLIDDSNIQSF